jgi:hypothetical protein
MSAVLDRELAALGIGTRPARATLAGLRDAHGGATRCPACGYAGQGRAAELELEVNPVGPVLPEMLMAHLGHAAAETRREDEAEAFVGALVPLATRLVPRAAPVLMRAAPQLIRGVSRLTRRLRRSPATRPLVRAVPAVVARTAQALARRAQRNLVVTPQRAVRTLARQADRVLAAPARRRAAVAATARADRRFHQAACPRTYAGGAPDPARPRRRGAAALGAPAEARV